MKKLIYLVFTVVYILAVTFIITSSTKDQHFQGEIIKIQEDDDSSWFPDLTITVKDTNNKQYTVRVNSGKSLQYSNSDEDVYAHELELGDYIEGTYYNELGFNKDYAYKMTVTKK